MQAKISSCLENGEDEAGSCEGPWNIVVEMTIYKVPDMVIVTMSFNVEVACLT